jgi:hypothetical protein
MRKFLSFFLLTLLLVNSPVFSEGSVSENKFQSEIQQVINVFQSYDKDSIANLIYYPLEMRHPVSDISNKSEMIKRFNEVFDEALLERLSTSKVSDWEYMGWRGIMFDNGTAWIDEDGRILSINHQTKKQKILRKAIVEADKKSLHSSVKDYKRAIHKINIKQGVVRVDEISDANYRLSIWFNGRPIIDEPNVRIENGKVRREGSAGSTHYTFNKDHYKYEFGNPMIGSEANPAIPYLEIHAGDSLIFDESEKPQYRTKKKENTSADRLTSRFKNMLEVLLIGMILGVLYWLVGLVLNLLFKVEIRSGKGYLIVIVFGGFIVQQALISSIKSII